MSMRKKIFLSFLFSVALFYAKAQQPPVRPIRIADSLTPQERTGRHTILLRSELDSLIKLYAPAPVQLPAQEPVIPEKEHTSLLMLAGFGLCSFLLGWILVILYRTRPVRTEKSASVQNNGAAHRNSKQRKTVFALEEKIGELHDELLKLSKENEGLNRVIKEYNGIQNDYDSLKNGMRKVYKVKNYPGYDPRGKETRAIQGVLDTESAVANYAWEKFLKPILQIADANKNSPARMTETDRSKLLDLLVSLSLLYIEYLYLRVADLSVGGTIVERIQGLAKGKGPDPALLKKLDTEFGNRALVLRMALDKAALTNISYPVFDETNLNPTA